MRIAVVTHNYPESAGDRKNAGIFVYDVCGELAKRAEVWVFCPHESRSGLSRVGETNVYWFKRGTSRKLGSMKVSNPLEFLSLVWFFVRGSLSVFGFMRKARPDGIVSMWAWPSGYVALLANLLWGKKYVVWALGSDINKYARWPVIGLFFRLILVRASGLYADGIELSRDTSGLAGRECKFLPSATKMEVRKIRRTKRGNRINLTFLGRMEEVKGPDILVEALISLGKDAGRFKVDFLGDGSLLEELKRKAKDGGIGKMVEFHGNVGNKNKIARILANSDWVVIPSRGDSIPLVFSEAMKAGAPIVVSDLPEISFLIKKYGVGYSFRRGDEDDLANVLKSLLGKGGERQKMAKNTGRAAKDFSVEESVKTLYNSLHRLI